MQENDDIKFDLAIAEKRHNEITSLLKELIEGGKNDGSKDSQLMELIKESEARMSLMFEKMSELSKPVPVEIPAPQVTVNNNNESVIEAVNESKKEVLKSLNILSGLMQQLIEVRKAPVEMTPVMNGFGTIVKVDVKTIMPKTKFTA